MSTEHHNIQSALVAWYNLRYHDGLLIAIPNAGKRSVAGGAALKREGMQKGVLDLFLAMPARTEFPTSEPPFYGAWIEVKLSSECTKKRGGLTKEQEEFGERMRWQGYTTKVVYSTQEGIDWIDRYRG